jgi:hypothetical protein
VSRAACFVAVAACAARGPQAPLAALPAAASAPDVAPPELAREWYAKATMAAELGDSEEAARSVAWLLRLDGDRAWAHVAAARVWDTLGDAAATSAAVAAACARSADVDAALRAERLGACAPP